MAYIPKACFGKTKVSIADLSVTFPQEYQLLRHRSKTPNKRKGRINNGNGSIGDAPEGVS